MLRILIIDESRARAAELCAALAMDRAQRTGTDRPCARQERILAASPPATFEPGTDQGVRRLLDGDRPEHGGFAQGISAAQYQAVTQVSKATTTRHLVDLVAKGCLVKLPGGGRNTRYQIAPESPKGASPLP